MRRDTGEGYREMLERLAQESGIAEPKQKGFSRWRGDEAARRAATNNRVRLNGFL